MIKTVLIGLTAPFLAVTVLAQESTGSGEASSSTTKPIFIENSPQLVDETGNAKVVEPSSFETENPQSSLGFESTATNGGGREIASESDLASAKIAKEKTYPGGRDEDDLEVQVEREKPTRKMGGKTEVESAPLNENEF